MEAGLYTAKSTRSAGTYISSNQLGIILGSLSNNIRHIILYQSTAFNSHNSQITFYCVAENSSAILYIYTIK
jgi:hypothetical protein